MTAHLDPAGRVVIPKPIRDRLRLAPGDTLEIECRGQEICLRPVPHKAALCKEHGVWVYRNGDPVSVTIESLLDQVRAERYEDLLG